MSSEVYIKMYVDAIHSGMIADMGAERWQTLCVLAAFMNENGECYPSQDLIARRLGVSREAANRRIKRLYDYRWNGERLIEKRRIKSEKDKRFSKTIYRFRGPCPFSIFKGEPPTNGAM